MTAPKDAMFYIVAGTRPNFMKVAPVLRALRSRGLRTRLMHTGQHFDDAMSAVFFRDLDIPEPDVCLRAGGGSHAEQTAAVLVGIEKDLVANRPSAVVVVGDVTSTLAAALAAAKLGIPIAHVEAGLRSRDWTMPEEINRVLTDQLADLLLTPSADAEPNLLREGVPPNRICFVGNVMIDSLHHARAKPTEALGTFGVDHETFALATIHRPVNVDTKNALERTVDALEPAARRMTVLFPMHPRTVARAEAFGLKARIEALRGLRVTPPIGYRDFVTLMARAAVVLTDSGGIQEETTALGVPCLTLRESTERPITVDEGTNTIVGLDAERIDLELGSILRNGGKRGRVPHGWDGRAGERIAEALVRFVEGTPPARARRSPEE